MSALNRPLFYTGLHQPADAKHFDRCMISINRLENRQSDFEVGDWILDSGAFTRITSGKGHMPTAAYARLIRRWNHCGNLVAAVSQDYMCEPFVLKITGLTIRDHQQMTLRNYIKLKAITPFVYVMPVLQGFEPTDYQRHVAMYGDRLAHGAWVGVGSVCKRNAVIHDVEKVVEAIAEVRPDLKLHGFGLKQTALKSHIINELLYSCDSMAWSFGERRAGRNANDWRAGMRYQKTVETLPVQMNAWPRWLP
jgi:hypothetical protein